MLITSHLLLWCPFISLKKEVWLKKRQTNSKTPYCWCVACHSCSLLSRAWLARSSRPWSLCVIAQWRGSVRTRSHGRRDKKGDIGWSAGAGQTFGTRSPSWRETGLTWARPAQSFKPDHSWWRRFCSCFQLIGLPVLLWGKKPLANMLPDDVTVWFAASLSSVLREASTSVIQVLIHSWKNIQLQVLHSKSSTSIKSKVRLLHRNCLQAWCCTWSYFELFI